MKHNSDCRWEKTLPVDCEFRETHEYCPHPEHACTCPPKKSLSKRLDERGFKPVKGATMHNLVTERLKRNAMAYTVEFRHDPEGMSFTVYDVQDSPHDRLSIAADFKVAAESLEEEQK